MSSSSSLAITNKTFGFSFFIFQILKESSSSPNNNDRQIQHPQSARASSVQIHRHRTRWHQQMGMAGQPAQRLLLLLHGTLWPSQLLLGGREWEQSPRPLQSDGEDASAMRATCGQTWWFLILFSSLFSKSCFIFWPAHLSRKQNRRFFFFFFFLNLSNYSCLSLWSFFFFYKSTVHHCPNS